VIPVASSGRTGRFVRRSGWLTATAVGVGLLVALGVRTSALLLVAFTGAAAVAVGVLLGRRSSRNGVDEPAEDPGLPQQHRWVPLAWIGLAFVSVVRFSQQGVTTESVSRGASASVENLLEVAVYAVVAVVLVVRWLPDAPTESRSLLLLAWPLWAMLSSTWSVIPAYSLVRASQLLVAVLLALHTARVLDVLGDDGSAVARPFTRILVNVCSFLAIWAFAFPYTPEAPEGTGTAAAVVGSGERLAWYGVHPLTAATILGTAALLATVLGPRFLRMSRAGWGARTSLLWAATLATQGRGVILGVLVAVPVVLWVRGRRRPALRYLSVAYYAAGVVAAFALYHHQLVALATRGEGLGRLFNLNGRLPLWQLAIGSLDTLREVLLGSGLGASGVLFHEQVAFAGHAHNSLVDALVGTGAVGALLLVTWLSTVFRGLVSATAPAGMPDRLRAALLGVFVLLLVNGVGAPGLAFPGFVFTIACLLAAVAVRSPALPREDRLLVPARGGVPL
jgi:O-antigen ligase